MSANKHFAIEALEERNETLFICFPYVAWCVKHVWGIPIYYPCIKYRCYYL